ncbi:MAG: hypothetical protein ACPGED_07240, partial [Flavobacteriales bacterium]
MVLFVSAKSQNLVPNGSFEEFIDCPSTLEDIQAIGWSNSRGSCDYFNGCNNDIDGCGVGVPCNVLGYQEAFQGQAYLGFVQFSSGSPDYREQVTCTLNESLVIGETYYFSMKINRGHSISGIKASSGQGFLMSNEQFNSNDNPSPAFEEFTYVNTEIISDSTNWTTISTSFIAEEEYSEIVLGAFLQTDMLDTASVGTPLPYGQAYYFIDDVRLSSDSVFVNTHVPWNKDNSGSGLKIYPNPNRGSISFNQVIRSGNVVIRNTAGEAVMRFEIKDNLTELDCSKLP